MSVVGTQRAVEAGDEVARLYDRYGERLYRFCMGRLRSHEEAEDAVQNTFLRVYTALRKGTVPEFESAWIYKIAHNVCLTRIETTGRRGEVETPRDLDEIEHELEAPEDLRLELAGLADALAEMPANLRQAILLREWQGLSYAEIADAMGVSQSAVETLIFRARKHLAKALEQTVLRPARAVAALLDFGAITAGLRALLGSGKALVAGGGVAAKLAAGAAVIVISGAGVGTGLALTDSAPRMDRRAPEVQRADSSPTPTTRTGSTDVHTQPADSGPTTARSEKSSRKRKSTDAGAPTPSGDRGGQPAGPAPQPPANSPAPDDVGGTTPAAPTPPSEPPPPRTPDVATTVPTVSTPKTTVSTPVVTVTTPTLPSTPAVTVPTVQTPTVPAPTVQTPTVPTQSVPGVPPAPPAPSVPSVPKVDDVGAPTVPKLP